jgi:hypothetical protein
MKERMILENWKSDLESISPDTKYLDRTYCEGLGTRSCDRVFSQLPRINLDTLIKTLLFESLYSI